MHSVCTLASPAFAASCADEDEGDDGTGSEYSGDDSASGSETSTSDRSDTGYFEVRPPPSTSTIGPTHTSTSTNTSTSTSGATGRHGAQFAQMLGSGTRLSNAALLSTSSAADPAAGLSTGSSVQHRQAHGGLSHHHHHHHQKSLSGSAQGLPGFWAAASSSSTNNAVFASKDSAGVAVQGGHGSAGTNACGSGSAVAGGAVDAVRNSSSGSGTQPVKPAAAAGTKR